MRSRARPAPDLGNDGVAALILRLAGPAILGISAHSLQMLANAWFIADLGALAIATIAIAYPVTLLVAALGYGAGVASASAVSRALGRGERATVDAAASAGFWLAGPAGVALTLLIVLRTPFWLGLLGADAALAEAATPFTALSTIATMLMLVQIVGGFIVRAQGNARFSGAVLVASFGLNIALDAVLIRVLGLGTFGAGWAMVVAQALGAAAYVAHFALAQGPGRVRFRLPRRGVCPPGLLGEMLRIGAPVTASSLLAAFAMALFTQAAAAYGEAAVGALGLALRLVTVAALPLIGVMAGAQAVIGFAHGAGRVDRLKRAVGFVSALSLAYGIVSGALMIVFAGPLVDAFAQDAATRVEGARSLIAFAIAFVPIGMQLTAATLFQAIAAPRRAAAVSLTAQGLALVPAVLVLPGFFGFEGVLASRILAEFAADGLGAVLIVFCLREMISTRSQGRPKAFARGALDAPNTSVISC